MSQSPNRSSSRVGGTVLGLGTVGLGASVGKATDQQIARQGVKTFWDNWDKAKNDWQKADQDRGKRVIEELSKDSKKRAEAANYQRAMAIRAIIDNRKAGEDAKRQEAASEAAEQMSINKMVTEEIKRQREEGIKVREENRATELEQIHREREELLQMSEMEKQAEAQAKQEHIEEMRRWHEICKQRAKEGAQRRHDERKAAVAKKKEEQKSREAEMVQTRGNIVGLKRVVVKASPKTRELARAREVRELTKNANAGQEVRTVVNNGLAEKARRDDRHISERVALVKALQEHTQASRQKYEDDRQLAKEELQREVLRQKQASRQLAEEEDRERLEEQAVHIAGVRALVNRRRTETRISTKASNQVNEEEEEEVSPWA